MCGLCGELRLDAEPVDASTLQKMMQPLQRRGPDSGGHWIKGAVGMGHRRLSVIDLSELSNQPMLDPDLGLSLVFNGAIYNYPQIREQLQGMGHRFVSHGDTEVILRAYAQWGERCVEYLQGMFAFALWDSRNQSLFLARDRLGIKPLYYSLDNKRFRFASNMQSLLASGDIDKRIDPEGLHFQFTLHAVIPAPLTLLKGIRKLPPGHIMTVDSRGHTQCRAYWELNARRPGDFRHELEWIDAIHESLKSAVRRRKTVADVPVGVLLSGGLDSSLLVGLLAEAGVEDLRTFSIGFEDIGEEKGSEFEFSDQVVDKFQTQHRKIHIPNEQVLQRLPEAVANMAEPMVGQDAVAFYLLSEQVSKEIKVVLSGQGADEVFAGYFWYPLMQAEQGTDLQRFSRHYFDRDHSEYLETVLPQYHVGDVTSRWVESQLAPDKGDEFMDRVLRMDVTSLIVDDPVKRVDNMTMAWGLEARVPFLDHELVELAAAMPPQIKLKSQGKHPLKLISRGLLPDSVIDRPKGYFPMPALKYVQGDFLDFMKDILNSNACKQRQVYQRAMVERLLDEPEAHFTRLQGSKLWHLALLEFWMQTNVDNT